MPISRPAPDEHPPFMGGYVQEADAALERHGLTHLLDLLTRQPNDLAALVSGVSHADAHSPYAPGKWTLVESLLHLTDTERVFAYRLLRAARGDRTPLRGFEQNEWVPLSGAAGHTLDDVVAEFGAVRAATIALVRPLDEDALARRAVVNREDVSARALAWAIAGHADHHLRLTAERYLGR